MKNSLAKATRREKAYHTGHVVYEAVSIAMKTELKTLDIDAEQHEINYIASMAAKEARRLVKKHLVSIDNRSGLK